MTREDVRSLRQELGLSQDRFASLLCVARMTVMRWESGETAPSGLWPSVLRLLRKGWVKRGTEEMTREIHAYTKTAGHDEASRQDAMVECVALLATKTLAEM